MIPTARRIGVFDAVVRSLAAALGAALAAGAILGLFNAHDDGIDGFVSIATLVTMVAFVVALAHVLLLGLPCALLLHRLRRDTLPMMVASGTIIGAVPMALLDEAPFFLAVCAVSGAIGAAAFHLAGRATGRSDGSE